MNTLKDKTGVTSSKRVIAMTSGFTAIALTVIVVIAGIFKEITNTTLIVSLITANFTASLISLGLTIPEWFSKLGGK